LSSIRLRSSKLLASSKDLEDLLLYLVNVIRDIALAGHHAPDLHFSNVEPVEVMAAIMDKTPKD
jgi:hypothetical protein